MPEVFGKQERYERVTILRKAKASMDPFEWERCAWRPFMYLVETKDGVCRLCPGDSAASYAAVHVREEFVRPWKAPKDWVEPGWQPPEKRRRRKSAATDGAKADTPEPTVTVKRRKRRKTAD